MKIYDITQEVFGCDVYPGDPHPQRNILSSIENGDLYNLTAFSMCAHNGTHIDAPSHFIKDGDTITDLDLKKVVGYAYVAKREGVIDSNAAKLIVEEAKSVSNEAALRILISGKATITNEAAEAFSASDILLIGVESQTVGPESAPMYSHVKLLSQGIVILEGIRISAVPAGAYFLFAAPIKLEGSDGAPCRAILIGE